MTLNRDIGNIQIEGFLSGKEYDSPKNMTQLMSNDITAYCTTESNSITFLNTLYVVCVPQIVRSTTANYGEWCVPAGYTLVFSTSCTTVYFGECFAMYGYSSTGSGSHWNWTCLAINLTTMILSIVSSTFSEATNKLGSISFSTENVFSSTSFSTGRYNIFLQN